MPVVLPPSPRPPDILFAPSTILRHGTLDADKRAYGSWHNGWLAFYCLGFRAGPFQPKIIEARQVGFL